MPSHLITLLLTYKYWLLFPLACFEGPIVAVVVGFLVSLGTFSTIPTFIILILADCVPDTIYFFIGKYGHTTRIAMKLGHRLKPVEHLWQTHTFKTMMVSKWAYGLSTPLLVSAGLARLPLRRFLAASVPISVLQYAVLMLLGYFFGSSYVLIKESLVAAEIIIAGGVIFFVILFMVLAKIAKKSLPPP